MYRWIACDPLAKGIIDKGVIEKDNIVDTFLHYPWQEELDKQNSVNESKALYSYCKASIGFSFEVLIAGSIPKVMPITEQKDNGYSLPLHARQFIAVCTILAVSQIHLPRSQSLVGRTAQ
jgi:hypothetical protein